MNISREKQLFLKTYTEFDGTSSSGSSEVNNEDGLQSQLVAYNIHQPTPNSLLFQALIQQVCKHMEPDKAKRRLLYSAICKVLNKTKFLGLNFSLDELWPLQETFSHALSKFFTEVHTSISSQGLGSCTSVSIHGAFDYIRTDHVYFANRYQQSFEELEIIAKGGFGVVCKARNKVDDIVYAVKKIKFKYTNDLDFEKVIREVRSFAQLKHQNIVNYNNSWLETNFPTGSPVRTDSDSESYSSDGEQQNTNSSPRRDDEDHDVAPIMNVSSETSVNDQRNPSGQSKNWTSLLANPISSAAAVKPHPAVINSEMHILHQCVMIEENEQHDISRTSETYEEWFNEVHSEELYDYSAGEPHQQTVHAPEYDTKNSDAKYCHQGDECGDCNQNPSRRRRHSSGATCSVTDQDCETSISQTDTSRRRSYDRCNSLDLDPRKCTALVPKAMNTKWDISNLGVTAVLYIQMELCDQSLREWLDKRAEMSSTCCQPKVSIKNVLWMFEQIVQGVEYIHSKSIIHRDLKPKNIFLCSDDFIKIGDFGLAALCTETEQQEFCHTSCSCAHTQGLGTPPYSAPEQKKHSNYDKKVDIYSLGIILIELLHCCPTRMEFIEIVVSMTEGSVPKELADIRPREVVNLIQRLTNKFPPERPEAKEILSSLRRLKVTESLETDNSHQDLGNKEIEALEISQLKAEVHDLKRQLLQKDEECKAQIHKLEKQMLEKDEKIKQLELQLLYMRNCDNVV